MVRFDELPNEVRFEIFKFTERAPLAAKISTQERELINSEAQICFDKLALAKEAPTLLKSSIEHVQQDTSLSPIERIGRLYQQLKQAGFDDIAPFTNLQAEQINNAFEVFQRKCDQALLNILPNIALAAKLDDPCIENAEEARNWLEKNSAAIQSIEALDLIKCDLEILPAEIGKFIALETLAISQNKLTSLPPEIGKLTALKQLQLNNNLLTNLPPEIGKLAKLQSLYLDDNLLTTIPQEISNLFELDELYLNNNKLTALPKEIFNLPLGWLFVKNNPDLILPKDMFHIKVFR